MNNTHTKESELFEQLIPAPPPEPGPPTPALLTRFMQYCCKEVQTSQRSIALDQQVQPINYQNNIVKNTKYNLLSFLPKVLFNQFKFFFNLFFLVTALTQLVELLRVGLFITYIGPLAMVLSLTMGKEAYDDFNTYKRDIEVTLYPPRPIPNSMMLSRPMDWKVSRARICVSGISSRLKAATAFLPTWSLSTLTTTRVPSSSKLINSMEKLTGNYASQSK